MAEPYVVRRLQPHLLLPVAALVILVALAVGVYDFSPVFIVLALAVTAVNLWVGSVALRIDGAGIRFTHRRRGRFIPWQAVQDVTVTDHDMSVRMSDGTVRIPVKGLDPAAVRQAVDLNRR
jgi:hypothetical protein